MLSMLDVYLQTRLQTKLHLSMTGQIRQVRYDRSDTTGQGFLSTHTQDRVLLDTAGSEAVKVHTSRHSPPERGTALRRCLDASDRVRMQQLLLLADWKVAVKSKRGDRLTPL